MEGGSWTNNISWVRGYDSLLGPMEQDELAFQRGRAQAEEADTDDPRFRNALFHLMSAETSCYRYWGQGIWIDYGVEMSRAPTTSSPTTSERCEAAAVGGGAPAQTAGCKSAPRRASRAGFGLSRWTARRYFFDALPVMSAIAILYLCTPSLYLPALHSLSPSA